MVSCALRIDARMNEPRVDASVRFHKESHLDPENVYLALPFVAGERSRIWLDKCGAAVRPGRDQIPGTCMDYFSIQEGVAVVAPDFGIAIASPDGHLMQLGPLDPGPRRVAGDAAPGGPERLYAWLMTNVWETNFTPDLGGFYEFRYAIAWGPDLADPAVALERCRDMNQAIRCLRLGAAEDRVSDQEGPRG
jgi:hypothetical protein